MFPYKCPVCGGRGSVDATFYDGVYGAGCTAAAMVVCRSCQGTGIVWGYEGKYDIIGLGYTTPQGTSNV